MYWNGENRGEIQNLWSMTKMKVIRNFGGWKSRNFSAKGKILKNFHRVWNFFENMGKSETGGDNAPWPQGGWTPLVIVNLKISLTLESTSTSSIAYPFDSDMLNQFLYPIHFSSIKIVWDRFIQKTEAQTWITLICGQAERRNPEV